ncbi:hypothetical protein SAMN04488120_10126 [Fontimonas thermophila]|uniref:Uncharacterized protein n=1 Tax=Fontimonas thermophila TaxID=1076937 RepID=A0A1I2GYZ6_9GAMM|nr:hypothetical protein SAMN04488120_10126 [Fontimonas thermophila]
MRGAVVHAHRPRTKNPACSGVFRLYGRPPAAASCRTGRARPSAAEVQAQTGAQFVALDRATVVVFEIG